MYPESIIYISHQVVVEISIISVRGSFCEIRKEYDVKTTLLLLDGSD